jgi:hypothetical protein
MCCNMNGKYDWLYVIFFLTIQFFTALSVMWCDAVFSVDSTNSSENLSPSSWCDILSKRANRGSLLYGIFSISQPSYWITQLLFCHISFDISQFLIFVQWNLTAFQHNPLSHKSSLDKNSTTYFILVSFYLLVSFSNVRSQFTIYVNNMGSHNVHTLHVLRLCSTLAWWWALYSRNMSPYS